MKRIVLAFLILALPFISFAEELIQFRVSGVAEGVIQYLDTLESSEEFDSRLTVLENELKAVCAEGNWKLTRLKKTTKNIDRVCFEAIEKYRTESNEVYCVTFSPYQYDTYGDIYGHIDESIQYLAYVFIVAPSVSRLQYDTIQKTVFRIDLGESDEK